MITNSERPKAQQRKVVGDDRSSGVRITARVAVDTELPLRWFERDDGTFVLQFLTQTGWREVPIVEPKNSH